MKFSFKQQLVFYFFIFGFLVALMSSFLVFSINKDIQVKKYISKSEFKSKEREEYFLSEINRYKLLLKSIVDDDLLKESLNTDNNINLEMINKILVSRVKSEKNIFRIRFINNDGRDVCSIKKDTYNTIRYPLQNKSGRYYVKETMHLAKNKVWFSKIDLNYEFGVMERPLQPTLRIAYSVYIDDKKQGIIIINIGIEKLLEKLSKTTTYNVYLIDKDGEFIWHKTNKYDMSWSKYLNNKENLKSFYPKYYKNILSKDKFIGDKFYSQKIDFNNGEGIKIILEIKESLLGLNLNNLFLIMAKGLLITIILSIPFIYFVSNGLNTIRAKYENELISLNSDLKESNKELELKTIEIANESMKVNHLNRTLEKRVKEEVEKSKLQDKQMLNQSRLAQMGEMISMIAHQWRQPLTAISATTNNLLFKLMMDNFDKKEFDTEITLIAQYSQHLSKTIDDFRGFFKTNKNKEVTTLDEIITSTLDIVRTSLENKNIKIINDITCIDKIETYSSEVKQVILNLIKNAEDILIERKISNPIITVESYCENGQYCDLIVKDNAGGISEDIIDNIFDPYFSTKKEKDGTGLGLYMSKTIIEEHCGGKISVSNSEVGAIFKISFPQTIQKG